MKSLLPNLLLVLLLTSASGAESWPRFRGVDGSGRAPEARIPTEWSEARNLLWQIRLPGPGQSSPVIWGDRLFVTSYSGYGMDPRNPGNPTSLKRHLVCLQAATGELVWSRIVPAEQPEDDYTGYLTEHGYASSTPVTDGERVYVFFGKSGALAFDFESGRPLWQTNLGQESSNRRWGSAASPVLVGDKLIVNAAEESQSVRALDTATGRELWKASGSAMELVYSTPLVVEHQGRTDIVVSLPEEVWGLNPDNGKLRWLARTGIPGNVCPSPIAGDGVIYAFGGFPRRTAAAIRMGGEGDITESHLAWTSNRSPYVPTPVLNQGLLNWVDRQGVAWCLEAASGELVYQERLQADEGRVAVYASPVLAGNKLIVPTRNAGTFVLQAGREFRQLARNRFAGDDSEFNAAPAVSGNRLYLRSNQSLYCVSEGARAEAFPPSDRRMALKSPFVNR